jgi:phosphoserine phosphatase
MDGTVSPQRYVLELARRTGQEEALSKLLDNRDVDASTRSERIAELFRFVPRQHFEEVARELPLREGVIDWVNAMRRAGFMVGIVSDSYYVAAEVVRRRIFADFALAHVLQFDADFCTGRLHLNRAFLPLDVDGAPCKSHVVARFRADAQSPPVEQIWAMGDNRNDLQMLRAADRAFVIEPKLPTLAQESAALEVRSFAELFAQIPGPV